MDTFPENISNGVHFTMNIGFRSLTLLKRDIWMLSWKSCENLSRQVVSDRFWVGKESFMLLSIQKDSEFSKYIVLKEKLI